MGISIFIDTRCCGMMGNCIQKERLPEGRRSRGAVMYLVYTAQHFLDVDILFFTSALSGSKDSKCSPTWRCCFVSTRV